MKYCRAYHRSLVIHVVRMIYVMSLNFKVLFAGVLLKFAGASLQFSTRNLKCDRVFICTVASKNMFDLKITKIAIKILGIRLIVHNLE